jgi:hypothetical protein
MPKVSIYTRATTGGSHRRYVKATHGSTGPFFLRYEKILPPDASLSAINPAPTTSTT